jgi:predicted lipid-binding transport protein (Tim44 family)
MTRIASSITAVLGVGLILSLAAPDTADARRGGSFGSRGMRTFSVPRATPTAPQATAPVQRSMTAAPKMAAQPNAAAAANGAQAPARRGMFGGMAGGLLGGLAVGGLLGMLMGNGFGGMAGLPNALMQIALIGGGLWLLMALFRRFRPAHAQATPASFAPDVFRSGSAVPASQFNAGRDYEGFGGGSRWPAPAPSAAGPALEIGLIQSDRDAFERLLTQVQDAFGAEDYAALRILTTPEIMSYLSEELSQNATQGRRNAVSNTKLLQADIAEAWREDDADYATAALRYESIDVMRDRTSDAVVSGDPDHATETTELWTFVRRSGEPWKLSAIQEA